MKNLLLIILLITCKMSVYSKDYNCYLHHASYDLSFETETLVKSDGVLTDTTDMDASTIWYSSSYMGNFAGGDCRQIIGKVQVVRDILVGDRLCRILGVTHDGLYIKDSELPFYLKGGIMSFYEDETWKQLYDFNATVGDTVTYHVSKKYPYYELFSIDIPLDTMVIAYNPYTYVIDKIDTIRTTDGKAAKHYHTTSIGDAFWFSHMHEIIAEVGSVKGLFGRNVTYSLPECNKYSGMRCYSDDDTAIKLIDEPCDRLVAVDDLSLSVLSIYPNPGNGYFTIIAEASQLPYTYRVVSLIGRTMTQGMLTDTLTDIKADDWSLGMYMVTIYDRSGYSRTYKWIKE